MGRILYQLALMINAKTVFELGSAIGYSTIWWARAVGEGGRVIYTDGDRKKADEARGYFDRAGVSKQITLKTGDALELLSEEKQHFDIIFNDVDKEDYPRVFKLILPRLRKGGLFVTDNVLWSGKVAQDNPAEASNQGDSGIQPPSLQLAGSVHDNPTHPRRRCRSHQKVELRTGHSQLKTGSNHLYCSDEHFTHRLKRLHWNQRQVLHQSNFLLNKWLGISHPTQHAVKAGHSLNPRTDIVPGREDSSNTSLTK